MTLRGPVFGVENYTVRHKDKTTTIFMSSYEDPYNEEIYVPIKNYH